MPKCQRSLRICLVSDFFCPNTGGVETHIYYLAQCLIERGHHVIVITHAYEHRKGIRFLKRKLKAFSCLALECLVIAQCLNIHTTFTDHSLFGFADASSIIMNKLIQFSLANIDHVICVSYTAKENTVLRSRVDPDNISVIPNAVNCACFTPDPQQFRQNPLTICVISRLVYRKGTDILAAIIPRICVRYPNARFLIGGDGPKRVLLEQVREQHSLHERVQMLGELPHTQVCEVLCRGQIFLNTSLTEAFCMTIVEAASCGLHVVTTEVGGIPEVLPPDLMFLAQPTAQGVQSALESAIIQFERTRHTHDVWAQHERVAAMYRWHDVTARTERVYNAVQRAQTRTVAEMLKNFFKSGFGFGVFISLVVTGMMLLLAILEFIHPAQTIPLAQDQDLLLINKENKRENDNDVQNISARNSTSQSIDLAVNDEIQ